MLISRAAYWPSLNCWATQQPLKLELAKCQKKPISRMSNKEFMWSNWNDTRAEIRTFTIGLDPVKSKSWKGKERKRASGTLWRISCCRRRPVWTSKKLGWSYWAYRVERKVTKEHKSVDLSPWRHFQISLGSHHYSVSWYDCLLLAYQLMISTYLDSYSSHAFKPHYPLHSQARMLGV